MERVEYGSGSEQESTRKISTKADERPSASFGTQKISSEFYVASPLRTSEAGNIEGDANYVVLLSYAVSLRWRVSLLHVDGSMLRHEMKMNYGQ